jgi:exodeoxyribonuclease VII large subunit
MAQIETQTTNAAEISVSDLASALKRTLEDRFAYVRVRGEISGYRGPHSSGHAYFSLKDQNARLDAVAWRTTFSRLKVKPEEGLEVVVTGKISTFAGKSSYQIVVESLEPAGAGALMALLDARRRQLAAEGLFDLTRKRALPFLPRVIGVVTSPTGAVIRDILHRLADRFPARVILWPVRVQGEGSAEDLAAAIRGLNALPADGPIPRPDVLIVARGGGSLEDLWSFNDEAVVRAAAESAIPLISAVGHETDWTLIDHAADLRAPTPTAAAELCAPVRAELLARVAQAGTRTLEAMARRVKVDRTHLRSAARALPSPRTLLSLVGQRLDAEIDALRSISRGRLGERRLGLARLASALERRSPHGQLARWAERTQALGAKLTLGRKARTGRDGQALERAKAAFEAAARRAADRRGERLATLARRWGSKLAERRQTPERLRREIVRAGGALRRAIEDAIKRRRLASAGVAQVFAAVNYQAVLARGYALVLDRAGGALTHAEAAKAAGSFTIRFADGDLDAMSGSRPRPKRGRKSARTAEQDSLF